MQGDVTYWLIVIAVVACAAWLAFAVLVQIWLYFGAKDDIDALGKWVESCITSRRDHTASWIVSETREPYFYIINSRAFGVKDLVFAMEQDHPHIASVQNLYRAEFAGFGEFEITDLKVLSIKKPIWCIAFGTDPDDITTFATRTIREIFKDNRKKLWYRTLQS